MNLDIPNEFLSETTFYRKIFLKSYLLNKNSHWDYLLIKFLREFLFVGITKFFSSNNTTCLVPDWSSIGTWLVIYWYLIGPSPKYFDNMMSFNCYYFIKFLLRPCYYPHHFQENHAHLIALIVCPFQTLIHDFITEIFFVQGFILVKCDQLKDDLTGAS